MKNTHDQLTAKWRLRAVAKAAVRRFFDGADYLELDTPTMVVSPGTEVHLQYFSTSWRDYRAKTHTLFLRSSPELHMKQALALGCQRIYQLAPCFRNGGELAKFHHPEFTMLEWYEVGRTLPELMNQTLDLVRWVSDALRNELSDRMQSLPQIPAQVVTISVFEAFKSFAGIALVDNDPGLAAKARQQGIVSVREDDDFETAYFKILLERIEPRLASLGVVFLHDYPPSQAALARVVDGRAQRFELYIQGVEICNAFDELIDARENEVRLAEAEELRRLAGHEPVPRDMDYMRAISSGVPSCSGNALGFDRLLAVLLGEPSLDELIPFRLGNPWRGLLG